MLDEVRILVIDDDSSGREALTLLLRSAGYKVVSSSGGREALEIIAVERFQIVVSDLFLPDCSGFDVLQNIKKINSLTEVIVVTGHASAQTAVRAMKEGAFDYITKPIDFDELKIVITKAIEKQQLLSENVYLRKQLRERFDFSNIVGNSPAMQFVFERMRRIVKTDSTVLVTGESGTGKELVARALHFNGNRKNRPFKAVNCGAIPEALLESELFGHVKGAFTGAISDKPGKFEVSNHGTIFLDEIGTMPLHLQTKLLRVLQDQEVERVGSNKSLKLDVRVISATNVDLEELVRRGGFREDLYYRLNVIPLHLPPLRERPQDIMPLAAHFLEKYCKHMKRQLLTVSKEALVALERYSWPGNVRELENLIERIIALTDENVITCADLPPGVVRGKRSSVGFRVDLSEKGVDMVSTLADIERTLISQALKQTGGNRAKASALLNINRTTMVEKIRRLKLEI